MSNRFLNPHPRVLVSLLRYGLLFVGLILLFYSIPYIYQLINMLLISLLISYLLNPPVDFLERYRLTRGAATGIVFLILTLIVIWGMMEFSPLLWDQSIELRAFLAEKEPNQILKNYLLKIEKSVAFIQKGSLSGDVGVAYEWIQSQSINILQNLYTFIKYIVLVPFIAFFLTRDRRRIRHFVVQSVPNQFFEMIFTMYYKIEQKLGSYIRGVIIESLIIGILSIIGLWIVDVKYLFVIGIFAGISNIVPYFGPIAGAIPAIVVKFFDSNDPVFLIPVVMVFVFVQLLDNVFVKPLVVAKTMNLHPLLVLLIVVGGGQLYGILGMIFSIPLASMFIVILSEINWAMAHYSFKQ